MRTQPFFAFVALTEVRFGNGARGVVHEIEHEFRARVVVQVQAGRLHTAFRSAAWRTCQSDHSTANAPGRTSLEW